MYVKPMSQEEYESLNDFSIIEHHPFCDEITDVFSFPSNKRHYKNNIRPRVSIRSLRTWSGEAQR